MTLITFVGPDGTIHAIDAEDGRSLMEIGVKHAIPGIIGECGGSCACGSCHVYVDEEWSDKLPPISDMEREMLELTFNTTPASRLGCQIPVTPELAGLVLQTPGARD
jgi:ferredoxin, 2Fe-2S